MAQEALRTIVVNENGNRYVPYVNDNGKQFILNWNWIDNDLNDNGRIAVIGTWQYLLSAMLGGLKLCECLPNPATEHFADVIQRFS